jgi:hypothetical protein
MKTEQRSGIPRRIATVLAATLALAIAGCGKKQVAAGASGSATPLEQVLASWQQGDQAGAVQRFLKADWKSGPIFAPGSPLNHRESELPGLSPAAQEKLMKEVVAQLSDLKALAKAVRDQGQAAAGTDPAQARLCFIKLNECGAALDQPEGMKIVQLVGRAFRKMAAAETAKLGK